MKKKFLVAAVAALLAFSSVSTMAAESPTASDFYNVTIGDKSTGTSAAIKVEVEGGTLTSSTGAVEAGQEVTFTANAKKGYKFVKWVIEGDYSIVDGSLKDTTITILPEGDVKAYAEFVDADGNKVEDPDDGDDNSNTSPKTGAPAGALFVTLLTSGGVALASKKKYSK